MYWKGRDLLFPPKEKAILFVAHPDDDTLFFHSFIKEHKPYVVLCTAGWSLRRLPCFFKAMKRYGVKYRAYDLDTRDKRIDLLERIVKDILKLGPIWVPVDAKRIGNYPADEKNFEEKRYIFSNIYTTEKWVLEQYSIWVNHEKLEQVNL